MPSCRRHASSRRSSRSGSRVAHDDLVAGEHDRHGGLETLHVELVVPVEERQQIHGRQIAGRVVEVHVLMAIACNYPIYHVRVIARLAQVVGQLDPVVGALEGLLSAPRDGCLGASTTRLRSKAALRLSEKPTCWAKRTTDSDVMRRS